MSQQGRVTMHLAVFAWNSPPTDEEQAQFVAAAEVLPQQIEVLRQLWTGPARSATGGELALVAVLDEGGLQEYLQHPAHRLFQEQYSGDRLRLLANAQFESTAAAVTHPKR
ncbi:stress responsive alpha/beta barrel protein [Branchiibius hedensis]|uniref:Stress responsive A/B Barrel Domain n=1 Tax=Branchiibius hedensis TaxID=672460 RepID=A0A2Y8ZNE9_9MICO|nr:Dabb family protein [Branchiibius hedensis]PWJ25025.1 stress responsive alpha/beta barrel protein [Branchiibius hedensis]SSA33840.1 Stress responsive A/B Barrel Domain [Branchiibius hedensis]